MYYKVLYDGFDLSKYIYIKRISQLRPIEQPLLRLMNTICAGDSETSRMPAFGILKIEAVIREDVLMPRWPVKTYIQRRSRKMIISDQPNQTHVYLHNLGPNEPSTCWFEICSLVHILQVSTLTSTYCI